VLQLSGRELTATAGAVSRQGFYMQKKSVIGLIVGLSVLVVAAGIVLGFVIYSESSNAKLTLLSKYFRAFSIEDTKTLEEITAPGFSSDLPLAALQRGAYELYDFGTKNLRDSMEQRFLLVVAGNDGQKKAYLATMRFIRRGLLNEIQSINLIEAGTSLKP